jgi:3-carboxy-cis,cis-muconate cycloisomerase
VRALDGGRTLRDELIADKEVSGELSEKEIDRALDPAGYLGAADSFVDRALSRFREES